MINLKALKLPERIQKRVGIIRHKVRAIPWTPTLLSVILRLPRPSAAEIDIRHDALVAEVVADVAVCVGEIGEGFGPGRGVGGEGWVGDVAGDGGAREEPDADAV